MLRLLKNLISGSERPPRATGDFADAPKEDRRPAGGYREQGDRRNPRFNREGCVH